MKNSFLVVSTLVGIMLLAILIVLGFNSVVGYTTDLQNDDVLTAVAAVAFGIALVLKFLYEKFEK